MTQIPPTPPATRRSGVLVPVAALRTSESCGIGEYADLAPFARWAADLGFDLVQTLPVNDTGSNNAPYSALSAFALHPIHLHLPSVPGMNVAAVDEFAEAHRDDPSLQYDVVYAFKMDALRRAYDTLLATLREDPALDAWIDLNPWVRAYAAFRVEKDRREQRAWWTWTGADTPAPPNVITDSVWTSDLDDARFYAWLQMHAEAQLREAHDACADAGVMLKGDIPILMSEDSADVWAYPDYFLRTARAGAPPDMFVPEGQNWGFPIYDWDALAADDYSWWRARLKQAEKFYDAFRIDHVLGFFRIWSIPNDQRTGLLGHFAPSWSFSLDDLAALGFPPDRVRWLSEPHVRRAEVYGAFGAEAPRVLDTYFEQLGQQDLFNFAPGYDSESALVAAGEPPEIQSALLAMYADRVFVVDDESGMRRFYPAWFYERASSFAQLSHDEQHRLRSAIDQQNAAIEDDWARHGDRLLAMMQESTTMQPFAEDLGAVPACVPRVLESRGIYGMQVQRWTNADDGQLYRDPATFPPLTVAIPSVHDSSTLRGWWHEPTTDRERMASLLDLDETPDTLTPDLAERILRQQFEGSSEVVVVLLQDVLALKERYHTLITPQAERINVPGTSAPTNWAYRMPLPLEALTRDADLAESIRALTDRTLDTYDTDPSA